MKNNRLVHISTDAQIGNHTTIGPFTTIYDDVQIGENCTIGPNVVIMDGTRIGNNCQIFPGAVLGAIPQDKKFIGEYTTLELGDHVTVREFCTLNKGTKASGKTVIKDGVLLMAYTHIAHDCLIEANAILSNNVTLAGHVRVGKHALLGGLVAVQQFVHIGDQVMIAGASLVRKDVPPYIRAADEPLQYIGINSIGLKRRNFDDETIHFIKSIYDILYLKKGLMSDKLNTIENEFEDSVVKENILAFCRSSKNGIIRG